MNRAELDNICKHAKITYDTYSPGDGVTRYRFFNTTEQKDYFQGYELHTSLGIREAIIYARGFLDGKLNKLA